jgi:hypothetical protein
MPVNCGSERHGRRQPGGRASRGAITLAVAITLVLASAANAAVPEPLLRIPGESAAKGSAAGQFDNLRDVAGEQDTGHLLAVDMFNARIDEFTPWGYFVKAWGWDVAPEGAPGDTPADQLEICTTACQRGDEGTGPGQLSGTRGVTVDGAGGVYVYEGAISGTTSFRVQKFDLDGNWLLMWGGEVNKTTGANVCTKADVEGGDVCGAGVPGTADGFFLNDSLYSYIAYGPATDTIFVGDVGRIQEFDTNGNFVRSISLPGILAGKIVGALDIDTAGNFYLSTKAPPFDEAEEDVYKLNPAGSTIIMTLKVPRPESVAVDVEGNIYVVNNGEGRVGFGEKEIQKYLSSGALEGAIPGDAVAIRTIAANFCPGPDSTPPGNLYTVNAGGSLEYINAYGKGPVECEPPPTVPPQITAQYATSVGTEEAVVRAEINPNFFTDTTYFVEYGTSPCSGGGCTQTASATLTGKVTNNAVTSTGIFLKGLVPDTTYFFRFVAQSHGGGPVFGTDATFSTFAKPQELDPCANDVFRGGFGASLPDCRAYEMVSPLAKNNGDITSRLTVSGEPTAISQSAVEGGRFTYSSGRSFAEPEGAPFTSQYLASRGPLESDEPGWKNENISLPRTRVATLSDFQRNQFRIFSGDLCEAWLRSDADPPLASGAQPEYSNLYRRENCASSGSYEALTTAPPEDRVPVYQELGQQFSVEPLGISEDGARAIFVANDNLVGTEAPDVGEATLDETDNAQLYENSKTDGLRFVCILPSGTMLNEACGAGAPAGNPVNARLSILQNAISADGSRVFWTASQAIGQVPTPGRIYVRIDGTTTVAVSVPISPDPARFWGAANDGSVAVYSFTAGSHQGELYEFDVDAKATQPIADGVLGVMGMSEDVSRVYFASTEALGGEGVAGQPNLYLYERGGSTTFIATLPSSESINVSPISPTPSNRPARVSPDGSHAAFASKGSLTGFDNKDAATGQPDTEVYLYDATSDSLACVSCNPSGARPSGQGGVAATIPAWERSLYASRALSEDGNRLFFESFEALVLRDTNGVKDVYQWEAQGTGSCDAADDTFNEDTGGCVDLISSGKSPTESVFLDATPNGSDVFITTLSSLVPWDPDSVDVYDARVGGGFPPPDPPAAICEGEACQSPRAAPEAPTPASTLVGPGNPKLKPRCPKGKRAVKRRGKVVCVKRKAKHRKGAKARRGPRR